jgi:hypothetical protein
VELSARAPQPWEELLGDVAQITKAQHDAMKRGEPVSFAPVAALDPADDEIVDAEVVDDPAARTPSSTGEPRAAAERGDGPPRRPAWGEDPPVPPPSNALVTLEEANEDVNRTNRAAGVLPPAQVGRIRRRRS